MLLFTKHHFKAHGLFCCCCISGRTYYISVTDVVGGSVMTEVQKLLILPSCFKRVTVAQLLLAYEILNILFVTTVKHYFIQKRLPTMHFKEI